MCHRKQTNEQKNMLILVSYFSVEDTSSTDTSYSSVYYEKYAIPFLLGHPV